MTPFESVARAHIASRASSYTRAAYTYEIDRWLEFCAAGGADPARPTLALATSFRAALELNHEPLSVRRALSALSAMYEAALAEEEPAVKWNPFRKKLPKPPATKFSKTEAIAKEDAAKIFKAIEADIEKRFGRERTIGMRDLAFLRCMYDTGLRVSSVASLKTSDLFRRGDRLGAIVILKGGKEGQVEFTEAATIALDRWMDCSEASNYVFPSRGSVRRINTSAINKRLNYYTKKAGIGHVHPHMFRAAFITELIDSGAKLEDVQAAVHHSDPKTTLRYDRGKRGAGLTSKLAEFRKITSESGK